MKNIDNNKEKSRNIRNIFLPDWTESEDRQEVVSVPEPFQLLENTEQNTEQAETGRFPQWVTIVKSWTPEMTVLAWPKINQIIEHADETTAIAWVCNNSHIFFEKHLTSNDKKHNIYLTSDVI